MRSIFVNTGFIIALESVTDQNHEKARNELFDRHGLLPPENEWGESWE